MTPQDRARVVAIKILRRRLRLEEQRIKSALLRREGKVGHDAAPPETSSRSSPSTRTASTGTVVQSSWSLWKAGKPARDPQDPPQSSRPHEALRYPRTNVTFRPVPTPPPRGITHRDMKLSNILVASQGAGQAGGLWPLAGVFGGQGKGDDKQGGAHRRFTPGWKRPTGVKAGRLCAKRHLLPRLRALRRL